jgi:hypothetical protein
VKKITIVILTAIYLLSAIGVSASRFYCCGILKTTSLTIGADHESEKTTSKGDDCCKTTKQSFKVKDNHIGSDALSLSVKLFPVDIHTITAFELNAKPVTTAIHTAFNSHAPPFAQHAPIYTLNCTFRI